MCDLYVVQFSSEFNAFAFLQVADRTKHLPHLWDLCSNEIVVRSAKHILKVPTFFCLLQHLLNVEVYCGIP